MTQEVNRVIPQANTTEAPDLEPKVVSKPKFMPTYHRNAYLQSDLLVEENVW